MASTGAETEAKIPQPATPCWKKRESEGDFFTKMKDRYNEFVNTSLDEHKICLKRTFRGVGDKLKISGSIFGSSKADNELGAKESESSAPVKAT